MKRLLTLLLATLLTLSFSACSGNNKYIPASGNETFNNSEREEIKRESSHNSNEDKTSSIPSYTNENEEEPESIDNMRSDFKDAMDSYEAFYDEYCTFLKKYKADPTDLSLLSQYVTMMQKLADMDDLFNKWETSDLNDAEMKYFLEVQARVLKKLANAGQ